MFVFLFPGQGSQFTGMAVDLYDYDEVFTDVADAFFAAYGRGANELRAAWLGGDDIDRGPWAQPLLLMVGYAAAQSLAGYAGAEPGAVIGHSIGEWAAACFAGSVSLEVASRFVAHRARLLELSPPGGMVAVAASAAEVAEALRSFPDEVAIGAVNTPAQVIVSAPEPHLDDVVKVLRSRGWACLRARAHEPFHSPVMAGLAKQLAGGVMQAELCAPRLRLISAWSGQDVGADDARDPSFWAAQMAQRIRFWDGLVQLDRPGTLFVEAGPGNALSSIAAHLPSVRAGSSRVLTPVALGRRSGRDGWQRAREALHRAVHG